MNTYRRCKAKKDCKAGELVDFTTVEVFSKPVHVPPMTELNWHNVTNVVQLPRTAYKFKFATTDLWVKLVNFDLTEHLFDMYTNLDDCLKIVVKDRNELDFLVSHGVQPSDIQVIGEYDCIYQWRGFKLDFTIQDEQITPDGIVKA